MDLQDPCRPLRSLVDRASRVTRSPLPARARPAGSSTPVMPLAFGVLAADHACGAPAAAVAGMGRARRVAPVRRSARFPTRPQIQQGTRPPTGRPAKARKRVHPPPIDAHPASTPERAVATGVPAGQFEGASPSRGSAPTSLRSGGDLALHSLAGGGFGTPVTLRVAT